LPYPLKRGEFIFIKARFMTALAAKFETFDGAWVQVLALLLALTTALLPSLTLSGNLLLRYP